MRIGTHARPAGGGGGGQVEMAPQATGKSGKGAFPSGHSGDGATDFATGTLRYAMWTVLKQAQDEVFSRPPPSRTVAARCSCRRRYPVEYGTEFAYGGAAFGLAPCTHRPLFLRPAAGRASAVRPR